MKSIVCALFAGIVLTVSPAFAANVTEQYGDWTVKCMDSSDKGKSCLATQVITLGSKDARKVQPVDVLGVAVGYSKDQDKPQIAFQVPPHVEVKEGLTFQVDQGEIYTIPLDACSQKKCLARDYLADSVQKEMTDGKTAQVTYKVPKEENRVGIPLSLKGFGDALKALKKYHKQG